MLFRWATKMKITGTIDLRDQIAWINWQTNNPAAGMARWWNRLFLPIALIVPPVLFHLLGDPFHWGTYVGTIVIWGLLFGFWRFFLLLWARGRAKRKKEAIPFELERTEGAIRLRVRDRTHEYPPDKVSTAPLKHNLIVTMDGFPICITPRSENIDGEHTIEDIEKTIKMAEPAGPGGAP